jgi:PAS domain-containing protein
VIWVRETARAVLFKNGAVILVACEDITERKRVEEELRESERRYRYIFDSAGVSIWEEDFSQVKAAIDELKATDIGDFREYVARHPEFVRKTVQRSSYSTRIVKVSCSFRCKKYFSPKQRKCLRQN